MVYLLLADGFEEIEALAPLDFLRRCKIEIKTVSLSKTLLVTGAHGIPVTADIPTSQADFENAEMLILPGGMPGTIHIDQFPEISKILKCVDSAGGFLCAICAAPSILGKRGYLKGKNAVCYPGFETQLEEAIYTDRPVVRDGNIITAKAAGAAWDFAYNCACALIDNEICDAVAKGIFFDLRCKK